MDNKTLLQETKSEIRCILISNAFTMTVKALNEDFIQFSGRSIPFGRLGYKTLFDFLKSIPDVVQVIGTDPKFATVTPIVTKNLENLNSLVMRQKNSNSKKGKPNLRESARRKTLTEMKENVKIINSSSIKTSSNNLFNSSKSSVVKNTKLLNSLNKDQNSCSLYNLKEKENEEEKNKKNNRTLFEKQNSIMKQKSFPERCDKTDNDMIIHPALNHNIPDSVRLNLKQLIKQFPNGVRMGSLVSHFEKEYGTVLSYFELGFPNAIEFFLQLPDIFWIDRLSNFGDFLLFDVDQKISINLMETTKKCKKMLNDEEYKSHSPDTLMSGISKICDADIVPPGMMGPEDVIESIWNTINFRKGQLMKILITEVYDPTKFWFVIDDKNHFDLMNKTMDDMQEFYEKYGSTLKILNIQPNMYCAVCYANNWQRGYIVGIVGENKVKLFFIDYGSFIVADVSTVRYLGKVFQKIPRQAIRGRLDFVIPKNGKFWCLYVSNFFVKQIKERRLIALFTDINLKGQIVWMSLKVFENYQYNKKCSSINEILVSNGYAEICGVQACVTHPQSSIYRMFMDYLLPTFDDLENGNTYTYAELLKLQKTGLVYEIFMSETLKHLKQKYELLYNIDLKENNFNNCGHFKTEHFKNADSDIEIKWLQELESNSTEYCNDCFSLNSRNSFNLDSYKSKINQFQDTESLQILKVYSIGGHDLHCTVLNYKIYVLTDEFIKKFMPEYSVEDINQNMGLLGLKCKNIKITVKSHRDLFLEFQRSNIPMKIEYDATLQLTPLRSLDLILYSFKIQNSKVLDDVENVYRDVAD